jgi:hypothetical protein
MDIKEYFRNLRFDEKHHLGLGDIRITYAQQEDIIAFVNKLVKKINKLEKKRRIADG